MVKTKQLRKEFKRYRHLFNNVNVAICQSTLDGKFLDVNQALIRLAEARSKKELMKYKTKHFYHNVNDRIGVINELRTKKNIYNREILLKTINKKLVWVLMSYIKEKDENGKVILSTVMKNINKIKEREIELRRKEQFYRMAMESAKDIIYLIDSKGRVHYANKACLKESGCTSLKLIENYFHRCFDKKSENFIRYHVAKVIKQGKSLNFENKITGVKRSFWANSTYVPVNINNKVEYVMGIVRDLSGKKEIEEKLRGLVNELIVTEQRERRKVANYLHDDIIQNLAIARLKLKEAKTINNHDVLQARLENVNQVIKESLGNIRSLMSELCSPVLYEIGLRPAIESLLENIKKRSGVDIKLTIKPKSILVPEDKKVLIYDVIRELLMNVVKHAQVKSGKLSIKRIPDRIICCVTDRGKGFNIKKQVVVYHKKDHYGLFNIKERIEYIGGKMTISSTPGKGARVCLHIPVSPKVKREDKTC